MKQKTLPAITTMLVLVSPLAAAMDLKLYGVGHLSADRVDNGQDASFYVTSSSSRLGFAGEHGVNANMTVIFQYETGLDPTAQGSNDGNGGADSSGQIFTKGRPSFVGVSGNFGKALIGHMPGLDQWANDYNLFADQVGDLGNFWEASGVPGRVDNVMYYSTPTINGFDAALTYVPEEGVDDTDHSFVKGNYSNDNVAGGKLKLGAAYASIGLGEGGSTLEHEQTVYAFTLGYHMGRFSVGGGYQSETDIAGVSGNDRDSFSLGGSVKIGLNGTLKAQYASTSGDATDTDASLVAIGYDHACDEHTTLYVAYARVENDDNVQFSANGKGHGDKVTPALGDSSDAWSFGIVYKFDVSLMK
ncbi:MAG: porin [Moraxellaceae bacterium]|nr:MAG: porin [Moraxellaceae bacterium]